MGSMIRMTMADGAEIGVYHAPAQGMRRGGLVLVQEIFGVTAHIQDLCDSYAADGFEVLSPSLFDREEPGFQASYAPDDIQKAVKLSRADHPFELSLQDAQVCIHTLRDKGPVFMTGYCYGGSVTWGAACTAEGLTAASAYYGGQIIRMKDWQPKCPVILHFGRKDHGIPMEGVTQIQAAHPSVPVYIYEAGHGFNSDRRADYDADCAALARQRTYDLFTL